MKAAAELHALVESRVWEKELLLWVGSEKSLQQVLGSAKVMVLDLLDLFEAGHLPSDDEETKDYICRKLRDYLKAIPKGPDQRTVLVVKSIGLLVRYDAGVNEFYNWFVGSFAMTILLLEGVPEKAEWPEEVRCESGRLVRYFVEPGMVKESFGMAG